MHLTQARRVLVATKLLFWKGTEAFGWWQGYKTVVGISGFKAFP